MFRGNRHSGFVLLLLLLITAGCGGPRAYLHPSADFQYIKKVAVLPFENYSSDRFAGKKVQELVATEVLRRKYVDVVDFGEVKRVFAEEGVPEITQPDASTLKSAGERLGVQAFITGSVEEYGTGQTSSGAVVTITMRMLDARSAQILWQASDSATGSRVWAELFGVGQKSVSDVAQEVVSRMVGTLFR